MRVVISCSRCRRRYNAAGRKTGDKFRCSCGESLIVQAPRAHDASVVRCSSCGAPREKESQACGFCSSDFTLHERDLHSVCPVCFARVSDKARYCHHCATPMYAENMAGDKTDSRCPGCRPKKGLVSRRLGSYEIAVLECQHCAGLWLGLESLQAMLSAEARGDYRHIDAPRGTSTDADNRVRGYRPCVVCGDLMTRRNLAGGASGVVADVCGRHGVWFDADELCRLIAWTRTGGLDDLRRDVARMVGAKDGPRRRNASRENSASQPGKSPRTKTMRRPDVENNFEWLTVLGIIATKLLTSR